MRADKELLGDWSTEQDIYTDDGTQGATIDAEATAALNYEDEKPSLIERFHTPGLETHSKRCKVFGKFFYLFDNRTGEFPDPTVATPPEYSNDGVTWSSPPITTGPMVQTEYPKEGVAVARSTSTSELYRNDNESISNLGPASIEDLDFDDNTGTYHSCIGPNPFETQTVLDEEAFEPSRPHGRPIDNQPISVPGSHGVYQDLQDATRLCELPPVTTQKATEEKPPKKRKANLKLAVKREQVENCVPGPDDVVGGSGAYQGLEDRTGQENYRKEVERVQNRYKNTKNNKEKKEIVEGVVNKVALRRGWFFRKLNQTDIEKAEDDLSSLKDQWYKLSKDQAMEMVAQACRGKKRKVNN